MAAEAIEQPDRDRLDRKSGDEAAATKRGGVDQSGQEPDRDALNPVDYGSRRGAGIADAETSDEVQQGGASSDEASDERRRPTAERDRDYDPDGERTKT